MNMLNTINFTSYVHECACRRLQIYTIHVLTQWSVHSTQASMFSWWSPFFLGAAHQYSTPGKDLPLMWTDLLEHSTWQSQLDRMRSIINTWAGNHTRANSVAVIKASELCRVCLAYNRIMPQYVSPMIVTTQYKVIRRFKPVIATVPLHL